MVVCQGTAKLIVLAYQKTKDNEEAKDKEMKLEE